MPQFNYPRPIDNGQRWRNRYAQGANPYLDQAQSPESQVANRRRALEEALRPPESRPESQQPAGMGGGSPGLEPQGGGYAPPGQDVWRTQGRGSSIWEGEEASKKMEPYRQWLRQQPSFPPNRLSMGQPTGVQGGSPPPLPWAQEPGPEQGEAYGGAPYIPPGSGLTPVPRSPQSLVAAPTLEAAQRSSAIPRALAGPPQYGGGPMGGGGAIPTLPGRGGMAGPFPSIPGGQPRYPGSPDEPPNWGNWNPGNQPNPGDLDLGGAPRPLPGGGMPGTLEGFDPGKFADPQHQTVKYQAGRIFAQYPPTPEGMQQAFSQIQQAYPNARLIGRDKIDFGDGYGPIDVIRGSAQGGQAWQWMPGGGEGGGPGPVPPLPAGGVPRQGSVTPSAVGQPYPYQFGLPTPPGGEFGPDQGSYQQLLQYLMQQLSINNAVGGGRRSALP